MSVHVGDLKCVCVCALAIVHACVWMPSEVRGVGSPRTGVSDPPDLGPENQTQVLCWNSKPSDLLSHLPTKTLWVWGCLLSHQLLLHVILLVSSLSMSVQLE